jgi:syntaxin-binding protein 1
MSMDFSAPADDPKAFRNVCRDRTHFRIPCSAIGLIVIPWLITLPIPLWVFAGILKDLLQPDKDKETKSSWKVS